MIIHSERKVKSKLVCKTNDEHAQWFSIDLEGMIVVSGTDEFEVEFLLHILLVVHRETYIKN